MSMKISTVLLGVLGLVPLATLKAAEKPNIVVILADDLGYGDVHCLNPDRGKIPTPNYDRLAAEGMTFTDAHSGSSVCSPTRYGLLTGRYAWRTRLQKGVLTDYVKPLIAADRLTVAGLLKQNGYVSACVGKWHLGFTVEGWDQARGVARGKGDKYGKGAPVGSVTKDGPLTRGFDEFFGFYRAATIKSVFEGDKVTEIVEPVDVLPKLTGRATRFIEERAKSDQPFFLYFALNSPHLPLVPSKPWKGKSGLGDYGDFVMETDGAVGEVLEALDRAGVADNTLVIASSDNGFEFGTRAADELAAKGHFPSARFRGYKTDIWEGGHRVPFFARWPGRVTPGSEYPGFICLNDLMATCAEILEVDLPDDAGEDSQSILPVLLGKQAGPVRDSVVHHSGNGRFAVRQGKWKLELCPGSGGRGGKPSDASARKQGLPEVQLYDLSTDLGETRNLQAEYPEVVKRLRTLLERQVKEGRSTPGKAQQNDVDYAVKID